MLFNCFIQALVFLDGSIFHCITPIIYCPGASISSRMLRRMLQHTGCGSYPPPSQQEMMAPDVHAPVPPPPLVAKQHHHHHPHHHRCCHHVPFSVSSSLFLLPASWRHLKPRRCRPLSRRPLMTSSWRSEGSCGGSPQGSCSHRSRSLPHDVRYLQ